MLFAFSLWSYDAVAAHADAIQPRPQDRTMPCDGTWPQAGTDAFQRWTGAGKPR